MTKEKKFVRINPGVRPDQDKYIKDLVKKKKEFDSESSALRVMIDFYKANNK
ncbi:MAG: hypothetical protein V4509_00635 [Patescibacteria group bacterium]